MCQQINKNSDRGKLDWITRSDELNNVLNWILDENGHRVVISVRDFLPTSPTFVYGK